MVVRERRRWGVWWWYWVRYGTMRSVTSALNSIAVAAVSCRISFTFPCFFATPLATHRHHQLKFINYFFSPLSHSTIFFKKINYLLLVNSSRYINFYLKLSRSSNCTLKLDKSVAILTQTWTRIVIFTL